MKFLFIGLGSISSKHIKDLAKISQERRITCEITVLRRRIGEISQDLIPYCIKQITELDDTVYDVAFITNPTNLHYKSLYQVKGKAKYYFIEKPIFETTGYNLESLEINEKNSYVPVLCDIQVHTKNLKRL